MYKRNRILLLGLSLVLFLSSFVTPVSATSNNEVIVSIPKTAIKINGEEIDNQHNKFPMLTYKGITYLPLTWDYCKALGLEKSWDQENGLKLTKKYNNSTPNQDLTSNNDINKNYTVKEYDSDVFINGSIYENEDYPFLLFRQIIYLPLTYDLNTRLFISVKWDKDSGIEIIGKDLLNAATSSNNNGTIDKDFKEIANLSESVALIKIYDSIGQVIAMGSGVAIDDEGLIVTNYHVISQGKFIGVLFEDMKSEDEYLTMNVLGVDVERDLAIIKVDGETKPISIGDSDTLNKGDEIVAIGNPLGLSNSISNGIVSGIRDVGNTELIQMTAPISPGSSGGALLDMKGQLMGITTLMNVDGQNINFTVPSKYVKELLNDNITKLNMKVLNEVGKFNYDVGYITFNAMNYDYYETYIINLFNNQENNLDYNEMINDEVFKKEFKDFLVSKISQIANEQSIEKIELHVYFKTHEFSFNYKNGLIKDVKWTIQEFLDDGVLNVGLSGQVYGFDPQYNTDKASLDVINNLYEGLMREVNGEIKLGMAESYTVSNDGRIYTFKIRDTKWSDGQPVTASDFEYSWKRALDPKEDFYDASFLYCIQGAEEYNSGKGSVEDVAIEAVDDKTLKVTLNTSIPHFLRFTTQPIFMPVRKDIIERYGYYWDSYIDALVSNGPYKIDKIEVDEPICIVKNEEYYNSDAVLINKINIYEICDASAEVVAYLAGNIDILEDMSSQSVSTLKAGAEELVECTGEVITYLRLNMSKNPIDDVKVRKALSLAINREAITEEYFKGQAAAATGVVPNGISLSDGTDFREKAGDYGIIVDKARIDEAKKLLAEAGYPDPSKLPEIEISCSESGYNQAKLIKEMWEGNLGIDVSIKVVEFSQLVDNIYNDNYVVALFGWVADINDPMEFLHSGVFDYSSFDDEELEKALDGSFESRGTERDTMLLKAEKIIMDNVYVIPIYYSIGFAAVNSEIEGLEKTSQGYLYFGNTKFK